MKVGAAYLLLDPTVPVEDLESMVGEAGASVVYAEPTLAARLSAQSRIDAQARDAEDADETDDAPVPPEGADAICCLPSARGQDGWNGVSMRHRSVSNLVVAMAADLGIGAQA